MQLNKISYLASAVHFQYCVRARSGSSVCNLYKFYTAHNALGIFEILKCVLEIETF